MNFANLGEEERQEPPTADISAEDGESSDATAEDGDFIATDKKPVNQSAITLFVLIAVGAAATYFMHLRTGPQSARAADPSTVNAEVVITDFMRGGSGNVTLLRRLLDGTARIVAQFKDYTNVPQVPLSDLKANPFQSAVAKVQLTEDADEIARKKKEQEHVTAVQAAQALHLQTVVIRTNRKACLINNTMYQEGDSFASFTVEKISPAAVIVQSGDYRFELKMGQ